MTADSASAAPSAERAPIIDCDLWARKASYTAIAPYLPSSWREWLRIENPPPAATGYRPALPESQYFLEGPALVRAGEAEDWDAALVAHLDRHGVAAAILNPGAASSVTGIANPLLAAEVSRAVNDWTIAEWLAFDPRLLGSIVVSLGNPAAAAEEIRRVATNERMVQVVLAYPPRLLGDRRFHAVFEAAAELGLPINLQAGGAYSGQNPGLTGVGNPATPFEALLSWEYGAQPHLVSMICSGVFDRYPGLRLVLNGFGVAWLPGLLWRMDGEYHAGRLPAPESLSGLPSDHVREHVRFTSCGLELADGLAALLRLIDAEPMVVFGSGPLRSDDAGDMAVFEVLGSDWREHAHHAATYLFPAA